jgi:hypothetical protein
MDDEYQKILAVKKAKETELLKKAYVVGVGIGFRKKGGVKTGEMALIVMVRKKVSRHQLAAKDFVPATLEGVPVDVQEVGELRAQ